MISWGVAVVLAALAVVAGGLLVRWFAVRALQKALYIETMALRFEAANVAAALGQRWMEAGGPEADDAALSEALDPAFLDRLQLTEPFVYDAAAYQIGRLPQWQAVRIAHFHADLAAARTRLAEMRARGGTEHRPYALLRHLVSTSGVEPTLRAWQIALGRPRLPWTPSAPADEIVEALSGEFAEGDRVYWPHDI